MSIPVQSQSAQMAQETFRVLLSALSHPGTIYSLGPIIQSQGLTLCGPHGLATIAQTLIDDQVSYAVCGSGKGNWERAIARTTAAAARADIAEAAWVFFLPNLSDSDIATARRRVQCGTLEAPHEGATLLFAVEGVSQYPSSPNWLRFRLRGPGIQNLQELSITGWNSEWIEVRRELTYEPPRGIDIVLVDEQGQVAALPRSTTVERLEKPWDMSG